MSNITPGQARVGFQLFLAGNGELSQKELQAQADQIGVPRVTDRMFRHYRALFAAGYNHYIPINRFDVLQMAEAFGNESANSRYKYAAIGIPVRITVLRNEPFTFLGVADRVSDAGLVMSVDAAVADPALLKGERRLLPDDYVRIDLLEGARPSVDGRIVDRPEAAPDGLSWLLEIEFRRLRSVIEFTEGEAMGADVCPIRLDAADGATVAADVLGRRLFHLLDAIENARALFNEVADRESSDFRKRALPAQISHVSMDSPLEVTILIPVGVVGVLGLLYSILKGVPVAFKTVQDGRLSGAQARHERALAESVEMDNEAKRVLVRDEIRRRLSAQGAHLDDPADTSRLFNNALTQLERNIRNLDHEEVVGLELPAAAEFQHPDMPPSDQDDPDSADGQE